jgi:hypothetical protein
MATATLSANSINHLSAPAPVLDDESMPLPDDQQPTQANKNQPNKKRKIIRKLKPDELTDNFESLRDQMKEVTSNFEEGNDAKNLASVMMRWESWAKNIIPLPFNEFVFQAEKLCSSSWIKVTPQIIFFIFWFFQQRKYLQTS